MLVRTEGYFREKMEANASRLIERGVKRMTKLQKLPETELLVMQIIWKNGKSANSDIIVGEFNKQKSWERSAVLTLLKRLEGKDFVTSGKEGKRNVYTPAVSEKEYLEFESKSFLEKVCGNSVKKLIASLYQGNNLSKEDLEELKQFIEEAE